MAIIVHINAALQKELHSSWFSFLPGVPEMVPVSASSRLDEVQLFIHCHTEEMEESTGGSHFVRNK